MPLLVQLAKSQSAAAAVGSEAAGIGKMMMKMKMTLKKPIKPEWQERRTKRMRRRAAWMKKKESQMKNEKDEN